ncbi:MAG: TrmH family RNA methyltransferase [Thermoanaerobaculales bacterium]
MEKLGRHGGRVKDLRRRVRRRHPGEVIVDGRRLVADLVRWEVPIRELYLTAEIVADEDVAAWADAAGSVFELEAMVLRDLAPTRSPQGVLAVVEEPRWPAWAAREGVALWLDQVRDPGNLGAIVRAAAGLGAAAVLLSPECADPFGPSAVRGSAGAVFRVPVEREVTVASAAERVRAAGGEVWAAGEAGRPIEGWRPAEPCLLLLGAESSGLGPEASDLAEGAVTIPLGRDVESLNVAVATGVLLQHLRG